MSFVIPLGTVAAPDVPDWTHDFSGTDDWVDADAAKVGVDTANDELDFQMVRDSSNDSSSYDLQQSGGLGRNVSNTAFVMRIYQMNFSVYGNGIDSSFNLGISNLNSSTAAQTAQDVIGIRSVQAVTDDFACVGADAQIWSAGAEDEKSFSWTTQTSTDFYIEVIRGSATTHSARVSTSSDFTGGTLSSGTCNSTVEELRYVKLSNINLASFGGGSTGTIKKFEIKDAVASW